MTIAVTPVEGPDQHHRNERAQAIVRVSVAALAFVYICATRILFGMDDGVFARAAWLFGAIIVSSIIILHFVRKYPKKNHFRLALTMAHDYSAITYTMIFGGESFLILYAILLWATVGNGIRFGPRYHLAATLIALSCIGLTFFFSAFWRSHPQMTLTFIVTTIIVPAYIQVLISQRRLATEAALAANVEKSKLLAHASHDLRQPIHAISLFTASLRESGLPRRELEMVDNIDRALHSVSRLFRSLLDVSSLDSGGIVPRIESVPVGRLLAEIVAQNARAAEWSGVNLRHVSTRLLVSSDPALLAMMLQNLVSNALKYAPGKPVLIGCRRRGGKIAIEVHDCGRGIAPEHLPRIFDDFYRAVERGHDIEGVGLGLAIVKRLASRLGLAVTVRSWPGRGTIMAIEGLLLAARMSATDGPELRPMRRQPVMTPLTGLRVLLIDDDTAILSATTDLLQRWGCVVQAAGCMPETIVPCDLVISDFDLGSDVSGADCIAAARNVSPDALAIVLTGHDAGRVRDSISDPTIPILMKPIRPAELRSMMVTMLLRNNSSGGQIPISAPFAAAAVRDETPRPRNSAET